MRILVPYNGKFGENLTFLLRSFGLYIVMVLFYYLQKENRYFCEGISRFGKNKGKFPFETKMHLSSDLSFL